MVHQSVSRRLRGPGLRGGVAALAVAALWAQSPAHAAVSAPSSTTAVTALSTANCSNPTLSTPFASLGDTSSYALVPGQSVDDFSATGWTLSGRATVRTTTLADGATGSVLDLPSGSSATSPPVCVESDWPTVRMSVRAPQGNVVGVNLQSAYVGSQTRVGAGWSAASPGTGWATTAPLSTDPDQLSGWQLVTFTLSPGNGSETQVSNLYVDPRMSD